MAKFNLLEYGVKIAVEKGLSVSVNSTLSLATPERIKKLRDAGLAGEGKLNDLVKGAAAKAVAREMKQRQIQAGFFVEPNENKPSN